MALSTCPARTYRSPRVLPVFQARGNSSTTRRYSATARSGFPCRCSFSALRSVAARSIATIINRIKQGRRAERSTVRVGIAKAGDGVEVVGGGVALVAVEAVPGVLPVQRQHLAVPGDLRDDRRGGDRRAPAVAVG